MNYSLEQIFEWGLKYDTFVFVACVRIFILAHALIAVTRCYKWKKNLLSTAGAALAALYMGWLLYLQWESQQAPAVTWLFVLRMAAFAGLVIGVSRVPRRLKRRERLKGRLRQVVKRER